MLTARLLTVSHSGGGRLPNPLDADPPWMQTPPMNRMTHRCENITLPQTSLSGRGKSQISCAVATLLVDEVLVQLLRLG